MFCAPKHISLIDFEDIEMAELVTEFKTFDFNSINVKKPYDLGKDKMVFDIKHKNKPFVIQTPIGIVPYQPSVFENGYGYIDLVFNDTEYLNFLTELEEHVLCKFNKSSYSKNISDRIFNSIRSDKRVRYTNNDIRAITIFAPTGQTMEFKDIKKESKVVIIYEVMNLTITSHKYGIQFRVIQLQSKDVNIDCIKVENYIETYRKMLRMGVPIAAIKQKVMMDGQDVSILDNLRSIPAPPPPPPPPVFVQTTPNVPDHLMNYVKMAKMGIPNAAILQKMQMDSISEQDKNVVLRSIEKKTIPPPPPPPPPPMLGLVSKKDSIPAFLKDIQSGNFSLKKTDKTKKVLKMVDTTRRVPTLAEILAARSGLKKVK